MKNGSSSTEGGPLACPRCAIHYPLEERFCAQCGMPLTYSGRSGEEPITEAHERARKIKPQYAQGEPVKAGWARNQSEAELMQGLLLEEGIPSFLKRSALPMTDTDERLIAAAASIGLSSRPKKGNSTPAAMGTPSEL